MKLRFGRYRGRQLQQCPPDFLRWLLRQDWISGEFRERAETALVPNNATCLGPRWWYVHRALGGIPR
jgi:hypothetical protein